MGMQHTFSLTVLAEERRITNDAVKGTFQLGRQLHGLFEVVAYKFCEYSKAFVVFKKLDLRLTTSNFCHNLQVDFLVGQIRLEQIQLLFEFDR